MVSEALGRPPRPSVGACAGHERQGSTGPCEICEAARASGLPVLYDVMGEVASVELLATEYPEVDFIIPHLGTFADNWRALRCFLDILSRHPNVYTETSGVRRFDLLEEAVERAGAEKVLFGSDGPWLHLGVELAKVYALRLPAAAEALVLGGNLLRLIRRVRQPPLWLRAGSSARDAAPRREVEDPWAAGQPPRALSPRPGSRRRDGCTACGW